MLHRLGVIVMLVLVALASGMSLTQAATKPIDSSPTYLRHVADDQPNDPPINVDGRQSTTVFPEVCPTRSLRGVPQGAIQAALEDPSQVYGWGMCANMSLPCSFHSPTPDNPPRRMLSLRNPNIRYDSWNNSLVFTAGCR